MNEGGQYLCAARSWPNMRHHGTGVLSLTGLVRDSFTTLYKGVLMPKPIRHLQGALPPTRNLYSFPIHQDSSRILYIHQDYDTELQGPDRMKRRILHPGSKGPKPGRICRILVLLNAWMLFGDLVSRLVMGLMGLLMACYGGL